MASCKVHGFHICNKGQNPYFGLCISVPLNIEGCHDDNLTITSSTACDDKVGIRTSPFFSVVSLQATDFSLEFENKRYDDAKQVASSFFTLLAPSPDYHAQIKWVSWLHPWDTKPSLAILIVIFHVYHEETFQMNVLFHCRERLYNANIHSCLQTQLIE